MPIKRRERGKRRPELTDEAERWLQGEDRIAFAYMQTPDELIALWAEHGPSIVEEWAAEWPGTRPDRWWQYDAPEPRRRIGGIGQAAHEVLAQSEWLLRGIPACWISESLCGTYRLLGSPLKAIPVDPTDPPTFESEAAYLDRLGLLGADERERLPADAMEPEPIATPRGAGSKGASR